MFAWQSVVLFTNTSTYEEIGAGLAELEHALVLGCVDQLARSINLVIAARISAMIGRLVYTRSDAASPTDCIVPVC